MSHPQHGKEMHRKCSSTTILPVPMQISEAKKITTVQYCTVCPLIMKTTTTTLFKHSGINIKKCKKLSFTKNLAYSMNTWAPLSQISSVPIHSHSPWVDTQKNYCPLHVSINFKQQHPPLGIWQLSLSWECGIWPQELLRGWGIWLIIRGGWGMWPTAEVQECECNENSIVVMGQAETVCRVLARPKRQGAAPCRFIQRPVVFPQRPVIFSAPCHFPRALWFLWAFISVILSLKLQKASN